MEPRPVCHEALSNLYEKLFLAGKVKKGKRVIIRGGFSPKTLDSGMVPMPDARSP